MFSNVCPSLIDLAPRKTHGIYIGFRVLRPFCFFFFLLLL
jgi:hypothetical protein